MTLIFRGFTQQLCPSCKSGVGSVEDCGDCKTTGREFVEADVLHDPEELVRGLDRLAVEIHDDNRRAGWWTDLDTGADLLETRNRGELLMLAVTELSEAEEADAAYAADDKLPQYPGLHVELADCAIRLLDQIGAEQRRGGQQPLITFHPEAHTRATVRVCFNRFGANMGKIGFPPADLMRIVRDLSKALDEGYRKDKVRVARFWLTSALFRIIAYCAWQNIPLFEIIEAKRAFNRQRADHKPENRALAGGKKC